MVNLNSAVLTFDGPLYSVKTDIYHPNDKTYSGNCYSHVALKKGNLSRGIDNKTIKGQLISKCLIGSIVSTKKPTIFFLRISALEVKSKK